VESYDEDEKLCRSYDEEESSVETIMRRKTAEDIMKTKSSVAYDEDEKLCRRYI
jgi:hypothetical protein